MVPPRITVSSWIVYNTEPTDIYCAQTDQTSNTAPASLDTNPLRSVDCSSLYMFGDPHT
jgi:hypothetical protein